MFALVVAAVAEAAPESGLQPGELYGHVGGWTGNAYTVPKGSVKLHPLLRSGIGATDFLDVKVPMLGFLLGPQFATEVGFIDTDTIAVSIEPRIAMSWTGQRFDVSSAARVTLGDPQKGLFTAGFLVGHCSGCGLRLDQDGDGTVDTTIAQREGLYALRPELTYELVLTERSHLIVTGRTNIVQLSRGRVVGVIGAYYALVSKSLGISLGLNAGLQDITELNAYLSRVEGLGLREISVDVLPIPLPHAQVWFRL